MERNFRKASLRDPGLVNHSELRNTSLEKRLDTWSTTPPVGLALERLLEIMRQGIDQEMLFISYEDLCREPKNQLERFYSYLDLPYCETHNYKNVDQITVEDDAVYGIFGDHTIRPSVNMQVSQAKEVLGEGLCEWIRNRYSWYYERFPSSNIQAI